MLTDNAGSGRSDRFVVVFSTDRRSWFYNSRRVAGIRPDPDGRYTIRNLPSGEYFAVSADLEQGEWFDPQVLDGLATGATRVTLGEYERRKHDLIVR